MQVEEEEPGARLLPRASQTAACDLTELLSQLCLAPVSGSAHDSCFGWRMPDWAAGEDDRGASHAEDWEGSLYTMDF